MPQLRQNIVTGEWVVIAPERAKRPVDFIAKAKPVDQPIEHCPFEPTGESYEHRLVDYDTSTTFLIPNKFPAFVGHGHHEVRGYTPGDDFYRCKPAVGGHDVLSVKEHHLSLLQFPQATMVDFLSTIQRRYQFYRQDPAIEYVMAIYNHGEAAGASIQHPHGQIFASSVIPNHVLKEKHGSERYYEISSQCVYCQMIKEEQQEKVRVVGENDDFIAFTFFAARFPFEVWILPKVHQSTYEEAVPSQLENFASLLRQTLGQLDTTLSNPSLNFFIHSLPTTSEQADYYHWHLEIAPRVANYGGFEMGGNMIIDIVSPEQAAQFLLQPETTI